VAAAVLIAMAHGLWTDGNLGAAPAGWSAAVKWLATILGVSDQLLLRIAGALVQGSACGLVVRLCQTSLGDDLPAAVGGVAAALFLAALAPLALGPGHVGQAALQSLLLVAAVGLLVRSPRGLSPGAGLGAAALLGGAAGIHPTASVLLIAWVMLALGRVRLGQRWPRWGPPVIAAAWLAVRALGLAVTASDGGRFFTGPRPSVLVDTLGLIAVMLSLLGVWTLLPLRRARSLLVVTTVAVVAGLLMDWREHLVLGVATVVGIGVWLAAGITRTARQVNPAVGQACVGATLAIVAVTQPVVVTSEAIRGAALSSSR
jgi:hypothetical protein